MKMKKILNEWRRYTLAESLDKGLLQLGQPDGFMRAFVDALGTEYVSTTGARHEEFKGIVGDDFLEFLEQGMEKTKRLPEDIRKKNKINMLILEINKQLAQIEAEISAEQRLSDEQKALLEQLREERSFHREELKRIDKKIKERKDINDKYIHALNGMSFYVVEFWKEFKEGLGVSDESIKDDVQVLVEKLANLKSDYFIERIKENPEFVSFIEDNFYKFFDKMVEMVGVNPTSLWLGQKTSTGKAQPSNAPQIVAAGAPQDWFFANAGRGGGFHEFAQAVETKLKADPEINLRPPQPDTEPEPEPPAPPQSDRMADMMSRFGAFFGDK